MARQRVVHTYVVTLTRKTEVPAFPATIGTRKRSTPPCSVASVRKNRPRTTSIAVPSLVGVSIKGCEAECGASTSTMTSAWSPTASRSGGKILTITSSPSANATLCVEVTSAANVSELTSNHLPMRLARYPGISLGIEAFLWRLALTCRPLHRYCDASFSRACAPWGRA